MFGVVKKWKADGRLKNIFQPGERVTWIGRPGPKALGELGLYDGFFLLFLSFLMLIVNGLGLGLALYYWHSGFLFVNILFFPIFMAFALFSRMFLVSARPRQKRSVYFLTNKRILEVFFGPNGRKTVWCYQFFRKDLKVIWRNDRRGDVIVAVYRGRTPNGGVSETPYGFFDIRDPDRVFELLSGTTEPVASRDIHSVESMERKTLHAAGAEHPGPFGLGST